MKKVRLLSLLMALIMVLTVVPIPSSVDAKTGSFSSTGKMAQSQNKTYSFLLEYGSDVAEDCTEVEIEKWGPNDKETVTNGQFRYTTNDPANLDIKIISPAGKYKVVSREVSGLNVILKLAKKHSFVIKNSAGEAITATNVKYNEIDASERDGKYFLYLDSPVTGAADITLWKPGYIETIKDVVLDEDETTAVTVNAIDEYIEVGKSKGVAGTLGIDSLEGYEITTEGVLELNGNSFTATSEGYGKLIATKAEERKEAYCYAYKPLALGELDSNIVDTEADGSDRYPYIVGNLSEKGFIINKDDFKFKKITGGNKHWGSADFEYANPSSGLGLDKLGKGIHRKYGNGECTLNVFQTNEAGEKISKSYRVIFLGYKDIYARDAVYNNQVVSLKITDKNLQYTLTRQNDDSTIDVTYYSSNASVATIVSGYPKHADAGKVTVLSGGNTCLTGVRVRNDYSYEVNSFFINVAKLQEPWAFEQASPVITTTDPADTETGIIYKNVLKGIVSTNNAKPISYSIKRYTSDDYNDSRKPWENDNDSNHWRDVHGEVTFDTSTGAIKGINKFGIYLITAHRDETDIYAETNLSYVLIIKRSPQPIDVGLEYNPANGPYILSVGDTSGYRNNFVNYANTSPCFRYTLVEPTELGTLQDDGTFLPVSEINMNTTTGREVGKVKVSARILPDDIYEGTEEIVYEISISYMRVDPTMYSIAGNVSTFNPDWYVGDKLTIAASSGYAVGKTTGNESQVSSWEEHINLTEGCNANKRFWIQEDETGAIGSFTELIKYDPEAPTCELNIKNPLNDTDVKISEDNANRRIKTSYVTGLSTINAKITDEVSLVNGTYYYVSEDTDRILTDAELDNINDWKAFASGMKYVKEFGQFDSGIIYIKAVDNAGNISYINTNKLVCDNKGPELKLTPKNSKKLYNGDVELNLHLEDDLSGVEEATCTINGDELDINYKGKSDIAITVPKKYNTNDVKVIVKAKDKTGNAATPAKATFGIDTTDPVLSVEADNNSVINGKYFINSRKVKISINERNFDKDLVKLIVTNKNGTVPTISGWNKTEGTGNGDDTLYVAYVTFNENGEYSFDISVSDKAGNKGNKPSYGSFAAHSDFVVDLNDPEINTSYDNNSVQNGNFYKESRTLSVEVNDQNFENKTTSFKVNGKDENLSNWSQAGNNHYRASRTFSEDGEYEWVASVRDDANRSSTEKKDGKFIIDKTLPELSVSGVENSKAYTGEMVGFQVASSDEHFEGLEISLVYMKNTENGIKPETIKCTPVTTTNGASFSLQNLEDDGVYTLKCVATDKAGNKAEDTRVFSVNRNGSTFGISESTKKLIDNGYVYNVFEDIEIFEVNADPIDKYSITVNDNELDEGDYEVKSTGGNGSWYKVSYIIKKEIFNEEMEYSVVVNSTDANKTVAYSDVKGNEIGFIVDQTAPVINMTGAADGGIYRTDSQEVAVMLSDDGGKLNTANVYAMDETTGEILGDEFNMSGEELLNYLDENDGVVKLKVPAGNNIKIVAKASDCSVKEDGTHNENEKSLSNITVSTNLYDIIRADKPLLYASAGGFGGVIFIIFAIGFLLKRRKAK